MRIIIILFLIVSFSSCNRSKSKKSDLEIEFTQDTLEVGYTYWWSESGPFIGNCGEELALVFSGTITNIQEPTDEAGPLYTSQKGIIQLDRVFKIKNFEGQTYTSQHFFSSDCFNNLDLKEGDHVLVSCFDYENALSIPGSLSILKIASLDDPYIKSIKKYIDTDQNALKIKKDLSLWKKVGLADNLNQIIECAKDSK